MDRFRLNIRYVTGAHYKSSASKIFEIWPIVLCRSRFLVDLTGKIGAQESICVRKVQAQDCCSGAASLQKLFGGMEACPHTSAVSSLLVI